MVGPYGRHIIMVGVLWLPHNYGWHMVALDSITL
jgi:hypothetical protein